MTFRVKDRRKEKRGCERREVGQLAQGHGSKNPGPGGRSGLSRHLPGRSERCTLPVGCPTCGPRHTHMWLRMAMNSAQHKIVNLLKTLRFFVCDYMSPCI